MTRIFCIGFGRTGTSSLARALTMLGHRPLHATYTPKFLGPIFDGDFSLPGLDEYDAFLDLPVAPWYEQWEEHHPDAKFILTSRDLNDWSDSIRRKREGIPLHNDSVCRDLRPSFHMTRYQLYMRLVVFGRVSFDEELLREKYIEHVHSVRGYFRRCDRFLELDICAGDGWEKLCPFLGHQVVPKMPFPFVNANPRRQR